jgi:peptidoglycan-N-acetylglucosamine deacetylase
MKRPAWISMDVDSVASHLQGYAIHDSTDPDSVYTTALPRALELFERLGVRCTFFCIASEAARHSTIVRSLIDGGHEVASHSMNHQVPFTLDTEEDRRRELVDSRTLLESLAGAPVTGFRAPSWDIDPARRSFVRAAGYRYDASSYPSWMMILLRWLIANKSAQKSGKRGSALTTLLDTPGPYVRDGLCEFPITTTPLLRLPYYHTLFLLLPHAAFSILRAMAHTRRSPIGYVFHAVDFLAAGEDRLDPRIRRHPGMTLQLTTKLRLAGEAVLALKRHRSIHTMADLAGLLTSSPSGINTV